MNVVTLDQAINTAAQLPQVQQDMLIDILSRRRIETRRNEIMADANDSIIAFRQGRLKEQSAQDAITELHQAIEDDE